MNRSRFVSAFAVLAIVASLAMPADAQQAAAYTNPLDQASDVSNWYMYDYFGYWNVDSSPIPGHDEGASLNCNDGNGLDYLGYNYMYIESAPISIQGLQDPVLTWWCIIDLPDPNSNYFDGYFYLYDGNWSQSVAMSMGLGGWQELQCSSDWHQHSVTIPAYIQGSIIFYPYVYFEDYYYQPGNQGWFIDEMQILVPDITPPDPIIDLAAANPQLDSIELSWTSPFDDDTSGVVASFDLRMSTSPITGANFSNATQLNGEPAPDVVGTPHNVLITGLTDSTTYYFAIQTTDIAGNVSPLSNVVSQATVTPPPPPPQGTITGSTVVKDLRADDILPCSAGDSAAPTGLLALAGLVVLGFALRRKA